MLNDEPIAEPSTEKVGVVEQSIVSDIDSITSKIQKRLTRARNINDITKTRDALEKSEEETNDVITSTYGIAHPKRKQYLDDLGAAVDLANDLIDQALAQIEKPKSKNVETKPINTGPAVTQKPPFDEDAPTSAEDAQELEDLLGEDDAPNIDENPNSDYVDEPGDLEGFTSGFDPDDFDDFGFSHDLGAADMVPDHD